ncbi:HAD-IIB family hydrolase [Sulfuriferula nivalis]|uniref:Sucrose phosphatase-like domain-containing protein n=1 Tax=Sulfuriferula nivalis TaxID=2675298 RepID=A0A809SHP7_9PROT|nr:HAD-IIB family hydrolase [Sulfuriferula nivalis]BBP00990.1 hypothetical protein SFSGTM_16980 [Sulfuriferula nivalis]
MKPILLCTDLDRTLIPNGVQPVSSNAMARFKQLARRPEITLVYVSGRDRGLIEQAIIEFDLPQPDFAIADVGSTIYQVKNTEWQQWDEWDKHIAVDWQGLSALALLELLKDIPALTLQEQTKQNHHKLSFYVPLATNLETLSHIIYAQFLSAGIKANLIWSIDEILKVGLLDVLPASANKLHAINFLMQQLRVTQDRALFAGDSGNDLDVLVSDISAVLVANADSEVRRLVSHANKDKLYISQGNYLGMNGNYSAGILEGTAHFFPEIDTWLRTMSETHSKG